ncbi:MAG: hypothetical protein ACI4WG_06345 [Erysipelotrichaceae bacterium]
MNKLDIYQWLILQSLLEKYANQKDSLLLMQQMFPSNKRIAEMIDCLSQGKQLSSILKKDSFEKALAYYCRYIPLDKAINVVYQQKKQAQKNRKKLAADLTYQLLLLLLAICVFYVFMNLVLPSMINALSADQSLTAAIVKTFEILNVIKNILIVLAIVLGGIACYIYQTKKINLLWMLLHKYHLDGGLKCIATYLFVSDLKVLLDNGIALQTALDIIRHNKDNSLASLLAFQLHHSLLEGTLFQQSLDNQFFDPQFHTVCLHGLKNDDFSAGLADYKEIIELKLNRLLKKIAVVVQLVCYGFVCIIIVLAYQVLMIPLSLIEGF